MYRRVVLIVAGALFSLLSLVAAIITDLHDRDFPQALGAQSRLGLDFSDSRLVGKEGLAALTELDSDWNLGLVKVAPDLTDSDQQVFVPLNDRDLPATFHWFSGNNLGKVLGVDRLANSPPDGTYLVTGDSDHLDELRAGLVDAGVQVTRTDASVAGSVQFVVREGSFGAAVLAAFALVMTLALFWLSTKARGRALRVLGGCPATRIQLQDLGGFAGVLLLAAAAVLLTAASYVGVSRGWLFVPLFLKVLVGLQVAVVTASLLAALAMSASAWPSATMLATRQPAVRSLRAAAVAIQALTFLLVAAAAGPTWSAYRNSSATAAEMAQWKQLADQVAIEFGVSEEEMTGIEPKIGDLVEDAESLDTVAFSYTFTQEMWVGDFGEYSAVAFVNQRWLDLVASGALQNSLTSVPYSRVKGMVTREFGETIELLSRGEGPSREVLATFKYLHPTGDFRLPVAEGGSGSLRFLDDVLVAVVPSLYMMIDNPNLTSMASTRNVLFTDVAATQALLRRNGLFKDSLNVVYIAEEGLLRAQFLAYVTLLMSLAMVALVVAFAVAAAVGATISALLSAKRDTLLRLAGRSSARIVQVRVAKEILVGAMLIAIVVILQQPDATGAVLATAALGVLVAPTTHIAATRWCFARARRRQI